MLNLTTPKKQSHAGSRLYYVSSEAHPDDKHIVVRHRDRPGVFFCDCRDFFVRRLPLLNTPEFSLCKHGEFVRDTVNAAPAGTVVDRAFRGVIKTKTI